MNSASIRSHRRTGRITKWRQSPKSPGQFAAVATGLSQEQKLIKRLQKELKDAQLDRPAEAACYTKKGRRHLLQGRPHRRTGEIVRFIAEHANLFPVERMCKVLKVSRSGYYSWRRHPVGVRQLKQGQLLDDIRQVHAQSQSRYGSPRIADELRERGVKASRNRVARLMRKAAIRSIMNKKYRVQTTDSAPNYPVAKNLLNREFTADKPGQNRSAEAMGLGHYLYSNRRRLAVLDRSAGADGCGLSGPESSRLGLK